jgi:hypothetical protein
MARLVATIAAARAGRTTADEDFFTQRSLFAMQDAVSWRQVRATAGHSIRNPDFRDTTPVALKPGEACLKCGVIRSIREVQVTRRDRASYRIGDRVRVRGTQLELLAP